MRIRALAGVAALIAALTLTACSTATEPAEPSESSTQMSEPRSGEFTGLNGKSVAGSVTVTESEITFDGFSSDEGPDLHVYLTNGTDEAAVAAGVQIDAIAFDKDSQTFSLDGVNVEDYTNVVIHCDKAAAVFGAASLVGEELTGGTSARSGDFSGLNGKSVAGSVTVTESEITFDGFSSDEGPDLHVYLTNGTDEAAVAAGVQIDAIAFDEDSQTFSLDGVNVEDYTTVVIHCDKAAAVFGAAELS